MSITLHSRFRLSTLVVWLGLVGLAEQSLSRETLAFAASRRAEAAFSVLTTQGEVVKGELKAIGENGDVRIQLADGKDRTFEAGAIVRLFRDGALALLAPDPSAAVLFPEGDRIRSAIGAASETHLEIQSYSLGKLAVPLEAILGVVLSHQTDTDQVDILSGRVRNEARSTDVAWLANGDRLEGGFLGLSEKNVNLLVAGKPMNLDRAGVVAVGFDPGQVAYPKPEADFLECTFLDGSRLGLSHLKMEEEQLTAVTRFGLTIQVRLNELARVSRRSTRLVYLDERTVAAEKYVGYIGEPRPFHKNETVEGHWFRLSGQEYDRGLGTESRTLLAYRVEPGDLRFQASVGLDDRAGPLGNVVFKVNVDGKERFKSPPMSVRDAPKSIDIDITGAKIIVLITEFGERGNVRDVADWVEARIIR